MIVNKRLTIDLLSSSRSDTVHVVQGDAYTRTVELELRQGRSKWEVPEGVCAVVEYFKPDGTKGVYDTLPDGSAAWSAEGNILTIHLAPQMLTASGTVLAQVRLIKGGAQLSLFKFSIFVHQKIGGVESEDYNNWQHSFIPQVTGAQVGQMLEITQVDADGRVLGVKAVEKPSGADWNAAEGEKGHVLNRTHWVEGGSPSDTLEWDGDLTEKETVVPVSSEDGSEQGFVKMSDSAPTLEQLEGATLTYITENDSAGLVEVQVTVENGVNMQDTSSGGGPGIMIQGDGYLCIVLSEDYSEEGLTLSKGIWTMYYALDGAVGIYVKSLKCLTPVFEDGRIIHKLDNKFIDAEWMATGGQEQYEGDILLETEFSSGAVGSGTNYASRAVCVGLGMVKEGDGVVVVWDGVEYPATAKMYVVPLNGASFNVFGVGNFGGMYANTGTTNVIPDTGEPFAIGFGSADYDTGDWKDRCSVTPATEEGTGTHTVAIYAKSKLEKLPEKYIPSTVPVIQSATVGQTIIVSDVDENGRPTAWEAADLPDSSQNVTEGEKIVDYTVDADGASATSFSFTVEAYPKLSEYNRLRAIIKKKTNGSMVYVYIKLNTSNPIARTDNGSHGMIGFDVIRNKNYYMGKAKMPVNTSLYNLWKSDYGFPYSGNGSLLPVYLPELKSVDFETYTTFLDEGATIEIWGWNE